MSITVNPVAIARNGFIVQTDDLSSLTGLCCNSCYLTRTIASTWRAPRARKILPCTGKPLRLNNGTPQHSCCSSGKYDNDKGEKAIMVIRHLASVFYLTLALAATAHAQGPAQKLADGYPSKPIRFLVASIPGAASDVVVRLVSPRVQDRLGVPLIIDNRGGAGCSGRLYHPQFGQPAGTQRRVWKASLRHSKNIRTGRAAHLATLYITGASRTAGLLAQGTGGLCKVQTGVG